MKLQNLICLSLLGQMCLPALAQALPEPILKAKRHIQTPKNTLTTSPIMIESNLAQNKVFASQFALLLYQQNSPRSGTLTIEIDQKIVHQGPLDSRSFFSSPQLNLDLGKHQVQYHVRFEDGQSYHSPSYHIFNLGVSPPDHSYVLVDKYNFSLYWIRNGILSKIYPIATGRPKTPTVPGFWLIGQKEIMPNPNTGWGARRLKIYRENEYLKHWSGYAIHGTNRPPSIGTEASHGCVRMFNADVTELWQEIEIGTPVIIQEKLKVYIDEI